MHASRSELERELTRLQASGLSRLLTAAAVRHGFPASLYHAVASRETNCRNILGDYRHGQYHGVGLVQIDIQHPSARQARDDDSWQRNPGPLIDFGAQLLAENIREAAKAFPDFTETQHRKIAASGYNCGMVAAIEGALHGDSDTHTTGRDYGRDVMERQAIFAELLGESK